MANPQVQNLALYLITNRRLSQRPLLEQVAMALSKVDPRRVAVQLREKDLTGRELLALGKAVLAVCQSRQVPLLINDRLDVALALGASGVHLGGGSLLARQARQLLGPQAIIGISAHQLSELSERAPQADFATWGPVYFTPSKAAYGPPVGLEGVEDALGLGIPLLALGGVNVHNARPLREKGFAGVAGISAVFADADPANAAQTLLAAFDEAT